MERRVTEGGRRPTGVSRRAELEGGCLVGRDPKFTDEQKLEIALEMLAGKLSHAEICRKYEISTTYAYKLKDRAMTILREGMGRPAGKPDAEVEGLQKKVADLEQLAGDQALAIRLFKKRDRQEMS
jgi:transposase-like protein